MKRKESSFQLLLTYAIGSVSFGSGYHPSLLEYLKFVEAEIISRLIKKNRLDITHSAHYNLSNSNPTTVSSADTLTMLFDVGCHVVQ